MCALSESKLLGSHTTSKPRVHIMAIFSICLYFTIIAKKKLKKYQAKCVLNVHYWKTYTSTYAYNTCYKIDYYNLYYLVLPNMEYDWPFLCQKIKWITEFICISTHFAAYICFTREWFRLCFGFSAHSIHIEICTTTVCVMYNK